MNLEKKGLYSKTAEKILTDNNITPEDYSWSKIVSNICATPTNLEFINFLDAHEKSRLFRYMGHMTMEKSFDTQNNLWVICRYYGYKSTSNKYYSYYLDENCNTLHRDDGPATFDVSGDGRVIAFAWYKNGLMHRDGDEPQEYITQNIYPANLSIGTSKIGSSQIHFRKNNMIHRENGPAEIHFGYNTTGIKRLTYRQNNKAHRENGPAHIIFHQEWKQRFMRLRYVEYYLNGVKNRFDGPAYCEYYKRDKATKEEEVVKKIWYINGKKLDRRKFAYVDNNDLKGRVLKNRKLLVKTMLFDREYGAYLRDIIQPENKKNENIPSKI